MKLFQRMAYHHLTTPRLSKLVLNGQAKAYPFVELAKQTGEVNDVLGKHPVQVRCDHNHKSAEIFDADGKPLPGVVLFWFAWYAFHPQTGIYRAE